MHRTLTRSALLLLLAGPAAAQTGRDYISIAGSSTVYPFAAAVAEQFGKSTSFRTPKVESVGTGGGFKLLCEGLGPRTIDIANASRAIKDSEIASCAANGVTDLVEIKIGFDGIVLANMMEAPEFHLSRRDIYLALAKQVPDPQSPQDLVDNPYRTWKQVNPDLPDAPIEVLGPPPSSGTRDAFVELVMEHGCAGFEAIKAIEATDKERAKQVCSQIREDGAYVEAGENDNLIVQKLEANPKALGIFGYSFLEENIGVLRGSMVEGAEPTFEAIADGSYPVSRALYIYIKRAHADVIPGIREFAREFTSEKAVGDDGYLADKGLIPLPTEERAAVRATAAKMQVMGN